MDPEPAGDILPGEPVRNRTSNGLTIREMELDDISTVYNLGERLFTAKKWQTLYRTWDEYELVDFFLSDGEYCLIAEQNEAIAGFILGTLIEKRRSAWAYGYVVWLGVTPETKGRGIGTKLLARITEIFIRNGARMMLADTELDNTAAVRFFEKEGFGNTVQHVYFSKNLSTHPNYLKRRSTDRAENGKKSRRIPVTE